MKTLWPYVPLIFFLVIASKGYIDNNYFTSPKLYSDQINSVFMTPIEGHATLEAVNLFDRAKSGDTSAMSLLAEKYWSGEGVIQDRKRAFKMYKISAEQGNTASQAWVGADLYNVYILTKRKRYLLEAMYWLEKAADKNSSEAWLTLGSVHGDSTVPSKFYSPELSAKYLKMSAAAGNKNALNLFCPYSELYQNIEYFEKTTAEICSNYSR
jgi:TPR repeat protein